MSKRRNRAQVSGAAQDPAAKIPDETLERARQQLEEDQPAAAAETAADTAAAGRRARRRTTPSVSSRAATRKRSVEEMTPAEIEELLHNPTRVVSEDELRDQYGYVLKDLRNMGLLAAALFAALIVIALVAL